MTFGQIKPALVKQVIYKKLTAKKHLIKRTHAAEKIRIAKVQHKKSIHNVRKLDYKITKKGN
jgi:hypothetical protein